MTRRRSNFVFASPILTGTVIVLMAWPLDERVVQMYFAGG